MRSLTIILLISLAGLLSSCIIVNDDRYTLSGSSNRNASFRLDDELDIFVNGSRVRTHESNSDEIALPVTVPNIGFGDTIRLEVRNTQIFSACEISRVFLRRGDFFVEITDGFFNNVHEGLGVCFTTSTIRVNF